MYASGSCLTLWLRLLHDTFRRGSGTWAKWLRYLPDAFAFLSIHQLTVATSAVESGAAQSKLRREWSDVLAACSDGRGFLVAHRGNRCSAGLSDQAEGRSLLAERTDDHHCGGDDHGSEEP